MAISKSKRFEIFKRDNFTCQYCGQRPPNVVLECDHLHPVSKGGTDADDNLITACWDCNRGKRAALVTEALPAVDYQTQYFALQQELAEMREFLKAKDEEQEIIDAVFAELNDLWVKRLQCKSTPPNSQWRVWLTYYSCEEIVRAIVGTADHYSNWHRIDIKTGMRYVGMLLKRNRSDKR